MAWDVDVALTDEERVRLLDAAAVDEREDRLVRCSTAAGVRELMATFRHPGS